MSSIEPGWYPDPKDSSRDRYWNGEAWTNKLRMPPVEPTPPTPIVEAKPVDVVLDTSEERPAKKSKDKRKKKDSNEPKKLSDYLMYVGVGVLAIVVIFFLMGKNDGYVPEPTPNDPTPSAEPTPTETPEPSESAEPTPPVEPSVEPTPNGEPTPTEPSVTVSPNDVVNLGTWGEVQTKTAQGHAVTVQLRLNSLQQLTKKERDSLEGNYQGVTLYKAQFSSKWIDGVSMRYMTTATDFYGFDTERKALPTEQPNKSWCKSNSFKSDKLENETVESCILLSVYNGDPSPLGIMYKPSNTEFSTFPVYFSVE